MKTLRILTALALSALVFPLAAHAAEKIGELNGDIAERGLAVSDFPRWKMLKPNIYEYEDLHSPAGGHYITTVSMFVITPAGVVAFDAQGSLKQTQAEVDTIKKLTPQPVKYVIIGSDHGDHTAGNAAFRTAFPNVVFISSPVTQKIMAKNDNPPTETVADKRTLNVGGTEFQILNLGRSHTGGDLAVYLPQSKILYMSEIYLRGVFPAMRTAYPSEWVKAIEKAQAMDVSWYIPAHGFIDDPAIMKKDLEESRKALVYVIAEGKRLHDAGVPCGGEGVPMGAGDPISGPVSCPEAAKQAHWGEYANLGLASSQEALAIGKVYQEIEGKLK